MSLVTSEGILLRSHAYSESSQILRVLTPDLGIVSLVARGTRKRAGRGAAPVQMFEAAILTFVQKAGRDLHSLKDAQTLGASLQLAGDLRRFTGASLVAELLLVHNLEAGDEEIFRWVRQVLTQLGSVSAPEVLGWILAGGWRTMALLGFPPQLRHCVRCDTALPNRPQGEKSGDLDRFDVAGGGMVCAECLPAPELPRVGPTARRELALLVEGNPPQIHRGEQAHLALLEGFVLRHLMPSRRLNSFAALRRILNKTAD